MNRIAATVLSIMFKDFVNKIDGEIMFGINCASLLNEGNSNTKRFRLYYGIFEMVTRDSSEYQVIGDSKISAIYLLPKRCTEEQIETLTRDFNVVIVENS